MHGAGERKVRDYPGWPVADAERVALLRARSRAETITDAERAELRTLIYRETVAARAMLTARRASVNYYGKGS